jgi:predicted DNA-binding transcriptional regulator YafY
VTPSGAVVIRPEGFDLAAAWEASSAAVEARRGQARVSGRAEPTVVPLLRVRLGNRLTVGSADPDGRVEVEVTGPSVDMLVSELAGYGARLLVVDPPEARAKMAAVAGELRRLYGDPDPEEGSAGSPH